MPEALFQAAPKLEGLPVGNFRYATVPFAVENLPPALLPLATRMMDGFATPSVSYQYEMLREGRCFGHGRFHKDGLRRPSERHRILTIGGRPTLGEDGSLLTAGTVWEYRGDFVHRAQVALEDTWRLMLRVSDSEIRPRDYWRPPLP